MRFANAHAQGAKVFWFFFSKKNSYPMPIAAIIPVLNEQGAIGPTLARLPRDIVARVFVVDGGSTDGTVAEAAARGAEVIIETRRGYGRACLTGAERAAAWGADTLLFLDGDGADAVEQAGQIVAPVLSGQADLVLATRTRGAREPGSMGWHQVLAGEAIGTALGVLTGKHYSDMCAFRALRAADLLRLDMREMTYGWNLEMQIKAPRAGLRVLEVPLPYYRRVAGASKVAGNFRGTIKAGTRIVATLARVGLGRQVRPGALPLEPIS
jgi:glycosyltransferase involved in cell wall biosynthesis